MLTLQQTYDYLLTFKDEVRLVWKARWSLMKVLFLSTRVFAFATTVVYAYRECALICEHGYPKLTR